MQIQFHQNAAEVFIPDGAPVEEAMARTTHLAISAHQDDIEIMASGPILECFQRDDKWFTSIVVADGRGSPRDSLYVEYSDEAMRLVRFKEQKKAAIVGEYSAQVILDYPSSVIKDSGDQNVVDDLAKLLVLSKPQFIYTHNLADKHDTHVAVALKVISAIRSVDKNVRPQKLYGCEVWRSLDWLLDSDKVLFDLSLHENLQAALLGVFDSQICGGKRYDLASLGRRKSNATYFESHDLDAFQGLSYGMDMTPLIQDDTYQIGEFIREYIRRFEVDVFTRLERVG